MKWDFVLLMLPGLIVGLTFHEFAHAWSSSLLGDDFARRQGRVSLNPLRHLTPLGTLALLFLPIGWGKPVPVNLYNFKHPRFYYLLTSLAGPFANFLLAGICMGLMQWTKHPFQYDGWVQKAMIQAHGYLISGTVINLALAILNLFPIPPLDGSKIWPCLLPFIKPTFHPKTNLLFLVCVVLLVSSHQLQPLLKYSIEGVMQCAPQSDVFLRMVDSIKAGNKCLSTYQWAEAEEHFSTGIFYNSLSDACYFGRAMALFEQEKFVESLDDIDRALTFNPDHHYHDLRADILFALGRTAEARIARNSANEIAGRE